MNWRVSSLMAMWLACVPHAAHARDLRAKLAAYMQASQRIDHFSGAVLVATHGKVIYSRGFGLADAASGKANKPSTEFQIGSNTKQFTAAAILLLRDRGRLRLRERLCRFIPVCPGDWRAITLYELLTHTSGIPDYTSVPGFWHAADEPVTPAKLLASFESRPLEFEPGTRFRYSNSGYFLLGMIVRRISGEPYRVFLRRNVLLPLGLRHTGFASIRRGSQRSLGYERGPRGLQPAPRVNPDWVSSAGGLQSSVLDLYRWDRDLMAGRLLSAHSLRDMLAPHVPIACGLLGSPERRCAYGLGLMIGRTYGHEQISHGGEFPGFLSVNAFFPRQGVVVIAFDNHFSWVVREVARALVAIVFDRPYKVPEAYKSIRLSATALQRFVGVYRLMPTLTITVRRRGDQLYEQATGQSALPIHPYGPDSFFLRGVDEQIRFAADRHGRIDAMTLHREGRVMSGPKLAAGGG